LLYVSESYDRSTGTHFLNATFSVSAAGEPQLPTSDAHVVGLEWIARENIAERLPVAVVREPLVAYLQGDQRRYFGFRDAGITIEFADAD
jgi:hypothetical protein